ncbi:cytochrome P450 [Martensiomyces pterosporus]|nr:cytochrome P450 [Martensiomyces pterosporus]
MLPVQLISSAFLDALRPLHAAADAFGYAKLAATLTVILVAKSIVHAFYFSPLRSIPGSPLARITRKRAELIGVIGGRARSARDDFERYGDIYVYSPTAVSISNPSDARRVFASHSYRKADYYRILDMVGIENTLSTRSAELASMRRRQLGPYLTHGFLARMEPRIMQYGICAIKHKWDGLLSESSSGEIEVNYSSDFLFATFDTIGTLAFGREFGALNNDDSTAVEWIASTLTFLGMRSMLKLLPGFLFSILARPWERHHRQLIEYSAQSIINRRELLARLAEEKGALTSEDKPADMLQAFIDAEDPESKVTMDHKQIQSESLLMLIAGSESTANTLMWTVHLLTLYPEHYRRATEEARSRFGAGHLITFSEAKARLPFVEACIYESMRLAPVTGGQISRMVPEGGATIAGHFLPGGTQINVNMTGVNLSRQNWEEPYLFNPLRFIDNEDAKRNVFTFSTGVRMCPGRNLAWMEMLTILANVLKDYDLRLPDDIAHLGPGVLSKRGYPKLMDAKQFILSTPTNPKVDCRLTVSKHA